MNVYLTRHLAVFARLRDQRYRLSLADRVNRWFDRLLDPQAWDVPHAPRDPHDVEGRRWFRRALVAVCVAGYALLILGPPGWFRDRAPVERYALATVIDERCVTLRITGLRGGPVTWWDCTKTFSDGTTFRRVGDAKP